jgi:hydrogenase maturation protease
MIRCLVLCCGNPIRGDDGVAWKIAEALEQSAPMPGVEILVEQQWMPEMAERLSQVETVFFVDCSTASPAGTISFFPVSLAARLPRLLTHHMDAPSLLRLTKDLYQTIPQRAEILTVGAESLELREGLSEPVSRAIPEAVATLTRAIREAVGILALP